MFTKLVLLMGATLLLATSAMAQPGRLADLSSRLASDAGVFADSSYRDSSESFRDNYRVNIPAAMLAHQFSGAVQLFNRMVNDRRRTQELRDAFQVLQDIASSVDRNNSQQNRWYNIQRTMSDIARELNAGYPSNDYPNPGPFPDRYPGSASGRMTWKGRVDDDIRITVRGGSADVETIGGTPYGNALTNFTASLPPRRVNVRLNVKKGRGEVFIEQQPSRDNGFSVVIRIRDPKGGASDYEFELSW